MGWKGVEKRRFVRAQFPCRIIIHTPSEHVVSSHTENIGAGGIRVIIQENLDISTIVDLDIYLGDEPIVCKARIVWTVEKKNPLSGESLMYDTGLEFYQIEDKDRELIKNLVNVLVSGDNG
ncbi:MAG: hypothetical protein GF375_00765 [Candidatus Omnitrophica bacterium]|nr:hypothetical protein [Candidatus Omnitrophota bacterium]MBD3268690.1 hypothetical protein [Candidatus Omnitrophota bacterium]